MRKNRTLPIIICILVLCIIALIVFWFVMKDKNRDIEVYNEPIGENIPKEPTEEEKLKKKVEDKISQMSLKEKIGQMIIISYENDYTEELDNILKTVKPGGFIIFPQNVSTYDGTMEYISKVKNTADIPMIISIDQEGGRVQRIKNMTDVNVQTIPPMIELGKTNDTTLAYDTGAVLAKEIAAFGINTDFAPTLDIFSNPNNTVIGNRAFGKDAQTVINMALPFAHGMESEGIIPTFKHFPGHGDTTSDSHVELPVVTKTKEELYQNELLTFKAAIEDNAQMIMTAHIALPNVTGDYTPATLSKVVVNDILREELGFKGVVITDAINMKALRDNYTLEEICNYSINAGVDIILMPLDPIEASNTIENLVNNGTISEERINESVNRILTLKYKNKLDEQKELNKDNIGLQESIDIINKINM